MYLVTIAPIRIPINIIDKIFANSYLLTAFGLEHSMPMETAIPKKLSIGLATS